MVHALKEAWRVLKPGGRLIDLRPISVDTPLFIMTQAGWKSAGLPDQSPDRIHDLAANRAVRDVLSSGLFIKIRQKYFDVSHYWADIEDLKEDIVERWKDDIIVSEVIWQRARQLYIEGISESAVRFLFRKKITVYRRAK